MAIAALALVLSLAPAGWALAQDGKVELNLRLIPGHRYGELTPGEEETMFLEVRNMGERNLTDIRLNAEPPEGWFVDFSPQAIAILEAGSVQTVDVSITPAVNAGRGDYDIVVIAEANETRAVTSVFVRVESSDRFWLWVGVGVAAAVVLLFVFIYFRFGKNGR